MPPDTRFPSRAVPVLIAVSVLVVAVLALGARLWPKTALAAVPTGTAPAPTALDPTTLEVPCWSCPEAKTWPVRFRTDLDLLAPLGDGHGNAAEFFVLFEKEIGPRFPDAKAAAENRRTVEGLEDYGEVLAFDHPLLAEAAPWLDQSEMRFYPDVLPMDGIRTRIPNLLFMLHLARTWTARGVATADPVAGLEDCRRAIRMGRLLRQEDAVIINDLVGLACIHIGTRGVYDIAQRTGDLELALLASVVLGEVAPQRLETARRIADMDVAPVKGPPPTDGSPLLRRADHIEAIVEAARSESERRFRGEALMSAFVVRHLGTPDQADRMMTLFEELADDDDPIVAANARWCRDEPLSDELVEVLIE
jgi:hypothetical protein